jgi:hypothetical protein
MTTDAPARANRRAVSNPTPLFAPVTTASLPAYDGISMTTLQLTD